MFQNNETLSSFDPGTSAAFFRDSVYESMHSAFNVFDHLFGSKFPFLAVITRQLLKEVVKCLNGQIKSV